MAKYLLGIDIGTSSCKAALFTEDGTAIRTASASYPVYYPSPGWAEQDADDYWRGACEAVGALWSEDVRACDVVGIGIDGQGWSAIPVDAAGAPLCKTPIWMDTRAQDACDAMVRRVGADALFELCGNPVQPAYTLPKILWYKAHRPEVYARADKILGSNAYIALRLTGAASQDLSQAYGLNCFDMRRGTYDLAMCRALGVNPDLLPELAACHQIVGRVTKAAALQTGLMQGTPVVAGGLDAACGTLGAGVLHDGETQEQGGQAGGMSICTETYTADPRLILGFHVAPNRWLLQGGTVGGGGLLRWFEAQFSHEEREMARAQGCGVFEVLSEEASRIAPGADGAVFLPYMAGERSPIWNPRAKGVLYGMDFSKTRPHMLRALMEGAAYALRHNLAIAEQAGARVEVLRAVGGAANSLVWTQIKSDVTGKPIAVPASDTATTLGAAILAGVATGVYPTFDSAIARTCHTLRDHAPCAENRAVYDRGYKTYLRLYEQLRPIMNGED